MAGCAVCQAALGDEADSAKCGWCPKRAHAACLGAHPPDAAWHCARCENFRTPRPRLADFSSLDAVVALLRRSRNVLVLTGAGVSCSAGVPDFRSANGVYSIVQSLGLELPSPEALFDIDYFRDDPRPFFEFAPRLFPGAFEPTATHRFVRLLQDKRKLLRDYTQNIDTLEHVAGVKSSKLVSCHGSFAKATCLSCRRQVPCDAIRADVMARRVPHCQREGCQGVMKPNITFFGERLPASVARCLEKDRLKADCLLVMGTSLKVAPVSHVLQYLPRHVPQILINRERVRPKPSTSEGFDVELLGDCDDVVRHLCAALGWDLDGAALAEPRAEPPRTYRFSQAAADEGAASPSSGPEEEYEVVEVVVCDECSASLSGAWFHCADCFDYDLCGACHGSGAHAAATGHSFVADGPGSPLPVAPRLVSPLRRAGSGSAAAVVGGGEVPVLQLPPCGLSAPLEAPAAPPVTAPAVAAAAAVAPVAAAGAAVSAAVSAPGASAVGPAVSTVGAAPAVAPAVAAPLELLAPVTAPAVAAVAAVAPVAAAGAAGAAAVSALGASAVGPAVSTVGAAPAVAPPVEAPVTAPTLAPVAPLAAVVGAPEQRKRPPEAAAAPPRKRTA